jgi:hypothetical protein
VSFAVSFASNMLYNMFLIFNNWWIWGFLTKGYWRLVACNWWRLAVSNWRLAPSKHRQSSLI